MWSTTLTWEIVWRKSSHMTKWEIMRSVCGHSCVASSDKVIEFMRSPALYLAALIYTGGCGFYWPMKSNECLKAADLMSVCSQPCASLWISKQHLIPICQLRSLDKHNSCLVLWCCADGDEKKSAQWHSFKEPVKSMAFFVVVVGVLFCFFILSYLTTIGRTWTLARTHWWSPEDKSTDFDDVWWHQTVLVKVIWVI